ncbi:LITAF-like zinc ribbon domain-containing protein [Usnea florida]
MSKSSHKNDIEMSHQKHSEYPRSSQGTSNGGVVLDPGTSNVAGYEVNSSTPSAHPADPNSNPSGMRSTMEYAPQMTLQPQQKIDYQIPFGETSVPVQCPVCGQRSVSKTKGVSGGYTYIWALGLCSLTCLGCIPFCVKKLKNVEHRCGTCDEKLATWHRWEGRVDVHAWEGKCPDVGDVAEDVKRSI